MSIVTNNKVENNVYEMEFEVNGEVFEAAVQKAYLKARGTISVPGFRKGKAPRKMIESMYGESAFYEDAVNALVIDEVNAALDENKLSLVVDPKIDVTSIDKTEGVKFKATCTTKPEVTVSDYKGIEVTKVVNAVTDEDIDKQIDAMRERNARLISVDDRAAKIGDSVLIDFEGFVDGEAFEGGKASDFDLELGSGQFIPGFEDQIAGHNVGEEFDVNVSFPEDYHAENLKGKPAVFKVKLSEIKMKELPEANDDFVKDTTEFETLDALKADLKAKAEEGAASKAENDAQNAVFDKVLENMQADVPQVMFDNKVNELVNDFAYRLQAQGMDINVYLQYMGMDMDGFKKSFEERAQKEVRMRLALEKIAELENIEVTDDDVEAEYKRLSEIYSVELKKVKRRVPADALKLDIAVERAAKLVSDEAKIS